MTSADRGELDAAEKWSVDELRTHQLKRLQETVAAAYANVPHYRNALDSIGVHPSDINELADVRLLPFTGKADLRENYPFGMFAVPRTQVVRVHASSGTTGAPTVVGYTQQDVDTWADLVARSLRAAGVRPGDVCHVAYGYGLFTGGLGAHYGAERLGCTVIPMSGGQTTKQVQLLRDFGARAIMVTPSYFLSILDEMTAQGLDPRELPLQIGVFGAEPWTDAMRAEIEERAGIDAVDIYGLSEVMGPGVAMECVDTKDGPTIWEDHFLPEIIDPVTGEPVGDGEEGELVFTSLSKTGDAGVALSDTGPDPSVARHIPAVVPADGEDHRPQRRPDDRARRQCLPDPDRGARTAVRRAVAILPVRADPARPVGRADGERRSRRRLPAGTVGTGRTGPGT